MEFAYIIGLTVALGGLTLIDWRYKLAWFYAPKRTGLTLAVAIAAFIIWDIMGIWLGIFFHGGSEWALPLRLAPEFPLEELFFLALLTYNTLIVYRYVEKHQQKKVRE